MTTEGQNISVIDPVDRAIERVRQMLFRPFNLGNWFTIGFCAWLAFLGEGGCSGGNFGGGDHHRGNLNQSLIHAQAFVLHNLFWIVPVAAAAILAALAVWILLLWLSSRGRFMFLHCVALNKAEVRQPWERFARPANSLFQFRLVVGLIAMVLLLPMAVLTVFLIFQLGASHGWHVPGAMGLIGVLMAIVVVAVAFGLVQKLTDDFVVPIMFLRQNRCLEAWSEYWRLLRAHFGHFVLYLLFQIVIAMVIGMLVLVAVLCTCCILGCFLAIPYIGTVLLLPLLVFKRAYSLHYLAQYGPLYNVFSPVPPPQPAPPGPIPPPF